jgi:hypothetical protein
MLAAFGLVLSIVTLYVMARSFPDTMLWLIGASGVLGGSLGLALGAFGKLPKTHDTKLGKTRKLSVSREQEG